MTFVKKTEYNKCFRYDKKMHWIETLEASFRHFSHVASVFIRARIFDNVYEV